MMEIQERSAGKGGSPSQGSLKKTRPGGSVWPEQRCPVFAGRRIGLCAVKSCWFCRYANFHLQEQMALEVGVCCWPKAQMD